MNNLKTYNQFLNEGQRPPSTADADQFIGEVLKLGSRSNLFDAFMKKRSLDPNELSTFVQMVADQIKTKWR
jgi:hypothetical protein